MRRTRQGSRGRCRIHGLDTSEFRETCSGQSLEACKGGRYFFRARRRLLGTRVPVNPEMNQRPTEGHIVGEAVNEDLDLTFGQPVLRCGTHQPTVPVRPRLCN